MQVRDEWVFFQDIDWNDPENNQFNVDTRDFCCGCSFHEEEHPDIKKLLKHSKFFFTEKELKEQLEKLYIESGGKGEWRYLGLESSDERVKNWYMKYLRIWRTEKGFLICQSNTPYPKTYSSAKSTQNYLTTTNMNLTKRQLISLQQALGYSVMYAKTEEETAEFGLLKLDIEGALIRLDAEEQRKKDRESMGCPFYFCDKNPPCDEKCRYNHSSNYPYDQTK